MLSVLFFFLVSYFSHAASPITKFLIGNWSNPNSDWQFTLSAVKLIRQEQLNNSKGSRIGCWVAWDGDFSTYTCTDRSRQNGFCYNRGHVAKYILATRWKHSELVNQRPNDPGCSTAVTNLKPREGITPLSIPSDSEIWLGSGHYLRN